MQELTDLLMANWKWVGIAVAVLGFLSYDKAVALLSKVKLPTLEKSSVSGVNAENDDVKAITHLRNRAVAVKDKALLLEVKNVSNKFFDLHSIITDDRK